MTSPGDPAVRRLAEAVRRLAAQTAGRDHARFRRAHRRPGSALGRRPTAGPAFAAAFTEVSAELADGDGVPVPCHPAAFSLPKLLFRSARASGDCCTPAQPWSELPIAGVFTRCEVAAADGFAIRYATRADLIWMRRAAGRVKDLRRAGELAQLGRPVSRGS